MIILLLCILFGISVSAAQSSDLDAASWRKLGEQELSDTATFFYGVLFSPDGLIYHCRGGDLSTDKLKFSNGNTRYSSYMNGRSGTSWTYAHSKTIASDKDDSLVHLHLFKKCMSLYKKQR